ncbi:MAG TPA: YggS family pyridoxal phosphate-dependent enzyme [Bacteriovoracaceae bacterium]|nr:YggS family pyridoxal phosphate-dependent enzyme [Bacteriovoracaceae bacterium]
MPDLEVYRRKLAEVKAQLSPDSHLLIVSKQRTREEIEAYYNLGHRDFGENRVQDLNDKALALKLKCPEIKWHMIGHLQSNKINQLYGVPNLSAIHSVHNQHLLDKLISAENKLGHPIDVFLQMNTSQEDEKSGFETYTELRMAVESLSSSKKLKLRGLMTMGTIRTESFEAEALRCFQELNVERIKLESEFNLKLETSMGMSQDYLLALQEKSNWIRLGTMMF